MAITLLWDWNYQSHAITFIIMKNLGLSRRIRRCLMWIGIPIFLLVLLIALWQWDWFIPILDARASAAIGRAVTIGHLHVWFGRTIQITADNVIVENPPDWPKEDPPFASVGSLSIRVNAWDYIRGRGLVIPLIALDKPRIYAAETADGSSNFHLSTGSGHGPSPAIGNLRIVDGEAHVIFAKLKADVRTKIATRGEGDTAQLVVDMRGTYAAQPITAQLVGGALLSLRNTTNPWPINLTIANGPTHVTIKGTVQDPLALAGADVTLQLSGPDMGLLEYLVGFPIPKTPAYEIAGKLDFEGLTKIRFENFKGRLGNSDISGTIVEQPSRAQENGETKPDVIMDLRSDHVDLPDLNGFIGGEPGRTTTAKETPEQRAKVAQARASPKLLPDIPINIPHLNWADIHLHYYAAHIEGRDIPLDNLTVVMDVVGGQIKVHPISFGVGKGRLLANVELTPMSGKNVRAKADLHMQKLDVARLMSATHTFHGTGSVSGVGALDGTGDSLATIMGSGNGDIKMAMAGGDISALLIELSGLQFGNALLSSLGMGPQTPVQCLVTDLGLQRGILHVNAMVLETTEGVTNVDGDIDFQSEKIDLSFKTDAKHFNVGSLTTRISVSGTFKEPSIRPGAEGVMRAGAVAALAALFAPLAILPTVQFGTSDEEDARCGNLLRQARESAAGKALPAPLPAGSNKK